MLPEPLQEVANVRQIDGEPRRRWFYSLHLDLTVWLDPADQPVGFQLSYRTGSSEHALTWFLGRGYDHARVDGGWDQRSTMKGTPILRADGRVNTRQLRRRFDAAAGALPAQLRQLVDSALASYPSEPGSTPRRVNKRTYPAKKKGRR